MNSEVFIDILVKCFEFVGLTNGMRIGFKEGLKWQTIQS